MCWRIIICVGAALLIITIAVGQVLASPPPLPSSFYGTITINGENVAPGVSVSAWINGVKVINEDTLLYKETSVYAIDVPGDDPSTPEIEGGVNGDEVVFYIGTQRADQTGTWLSGANQELNLSAAQAEVWVYFFPLINH